MGPLTIYPVTSSSDIEMAEMFNSHFSSVFVKESKKIEDYKLHDNKKIIFPFTEMKICEKEIENIISALDSQKSTGPDEIHIRVLKSAPKQFSKALGIIFRRSIENAEVPMDWKKANITPLYKKGNKSDPNNYRGISLTSIVCKILEKMIRNEIETYLCRNQLIYKSQHGFSKGKSCLTNLIEFFDSIIDCIDDHNAVDIIYLDFCKAFDFISHNYLIIKLIAYGINYKIVQWIEEWITGRQQRVVINGNKSKWVNVTSGTPQGTVLSTILFLIFIDDIDNNLLCHISKFADDSKISKKISCISDAYALQKSLDYLSSWADKWNVKFNISKCKALNLGHKNLNFQYELNGQWIESVSSEKDLGVIISNNLKSSEQCLAAKNKSMKILGMINRQISFKSPEVILKLYKSYVRPHLEYCSQFWSPYLQKDIDLLENVQRRATKMIPAIRKLSYENRLKHLNLFSLERRRKRHNT